MPYLSLARKYRPQTFDEIVGQEHIATTLKNAIAMGRTAHAYLFTGPRGVGKTSTARILAKGLNCEKGPTPSPCGKCTSCTEISRGIGMDVIEIDGASNRGIDEIRNLKENIKFAPIHGKFRIYIIDEIHMLTQEAFNALLKTLEEPPPHVKFIFATTKPHKVLPTIVSRCQRFDFRRISIEEIAEKLKDIREKEKLSLSPEAIFLIGKASDGSLRDAEIILDQLLSFTKGKIEASDIVRVLGLLEEEVLFEIAECILQNEKEKLLNLVNALINSGKDPIFIASGIISHFRNLLLAGITKEKSTSFLALSEENYLKLQEQAKKLSGDEALYVIYTLSATIDLIKKTTLGRIPLEISLIKLTAARKPVNIKEILQRLSDLEERLNKSAGGKTSTFSKPVFSSPAAPPKPSPNIPKSEIIAERDRLLLQKIKDSWIKVLNLLRNRKMSIATFLSDGTLLGIKNDTFVIGFGESNSLHKEALEENSNKKIVEDAIEDVVGEKLRLAVETFEGEASPPPMPDGEEENVESLRRELNKIEPIVESAVDIFEGRITDIRKNRK